MNRKYKHLENLIIERTIAGETGGIAIVENYFIRERMENLKEQGWPIRPVPELTYTDIERRIYKGYKDMEELEGERVNRKMEQSYDDLEYYGELMEPQRETVRHK